MISLIYKIGGDVNPFKQAVTKDVPAAAAQGGSEAGKFFGQQMKSAVLRYIGAGAILSLLTKVAQDAVTTIRDATKEGLGIEALQEYRLAAEATGKSIAEIRKQALLAPGPFAEMMESFRKSGLIIKEADVRNLAEAAEAWTRIKLAAVAVFAGIASIAKWINMLSPAGITTGGVGTWFGGGPSAQTSAGEKFSNAVRAQMERREAMASAIPAIGGLVALGLGVGSETARNAGLVSAGNRGTKTVDDVVKAIQDVDETIKKGL